MAAPKHDWIAHAMRLVACLLMLAAAAVAQKGRAPGTEAGTTAGWVLDGDVPLSRWAALGVLALAAVVPLAAKPRGWWRTALLGLDVAVLGAWSGQFLSMARLVGWADGDLPRVPADFGIALLMLAMAFLYPLFGRTSHYCLHACPFGAAQELASRLPAKRLRVPPAWARRLAWARRGLWAALMLAAWCGAWSRWMEWELFGAFAWRVVPPLMAALAVAAVAVSAFVPRAYCRFVCPTGTLFKLCETNDPTPGSSMKAANFLNVLLASALVLLCTKLYFGETPAAPGAGGTGALQEEGSVVIDSTGLAPGAMGYGGPVPVEVEVKDGVVVRVSPKLPNDETPMFFKKLDEAGLWRAWDGMAVGAAATAEVDAVASATYSSKAAIENVRAALAAAAGESREPAAPPPAAGNAPPDAKSGSDFALSALGADAAAAIAAQVPKPAGEN